VFLCGRAGSAIPLPSPHVTCSVGFYQSSPSSTSCATCGLGTISLSGSSSCTSCPSLVFLLPQSIHLSQLYSREQLTLSSMSSCYLCGLGQSSPSSATQCLLLSRRDFSNTTASLSVSLFPGNSNSSLVNRIAKIVI